MAFFAAISFFLLVGVSGIVQLCPCTVASKWNVTTLNAQSKLRPLTNTSNCLAITPGPPTWGPEGSGALVETCFPPNSGGDWQEWTVRSSQIMWPKNSSMCLTVLPPKPAPKALVGLWFCGKQGFEAAQAFDAVVAGAVPLYQLQLKNTIDDLALCVSLKGTC